jgi:hypothetical protein
LLLIFFLSFARFKKGKKNKTMLIAFPKQHGSMQFPQDLLGSTISCRHQTLLKVAYNNKHTSLLLCIHVLEFSFFC